MTAARVPSVHVGLELFEVPAPVGTPVLAVATSESRSARLHVHHDHMVLLFCCGDLKSVYILLKISSLKMKTGNLSIAKQAGPSCSLAIALCDGWLRKRSDFCIDNLRTALQGDRPVFGICMGNQLVGRAAGCETYKMKFGHRSQNQPCKQVGTERCFITSQNHGYALDGKTLPEDWEEWFVNANDGSNEGIRHKSKPFWTVQFHPEAKPGPEDTAFLFDEFVEKLR